MPKPKKVESSDSDSGPEDRNPSKKRKTENEQSSFELGHKRQASITVFRGKVYLDIREFYEDSNGDLKPGKKGISLTIEQWNRLKGHMDDIDRALKEKE